ncbi:MAG: response regulator [Candidatus Omnitrophica bacterium]|nr:response regulator [Candidatus Omnitrophota bacterium]
MIAKRILITDDDLEFCEEVSELLRGEGYIADFVCDFCKVEGLIRNGSYEIIFLDYKMPGLTGVDILKKIKSYNVKMTIFLVSGRPFLEDVLKEENLSDMVSGILKKPIKPEEFLEKIKNS